MGMRLPFVSREAYDLQNEMIAKLRQENADLKALFNKTSAFEVVEQSENRVTLKLKSEVPGTPIVSGRSGWRGRRAAEEAQTVPAPADSAQALEQRVKEQRKALQEN